MDKQFVIHAATRTEYVEDVVSYLAKVSPIAFELLDSITWGGGAR